MVFGIRKLLFLLTLMLFSRPFNIFCQEVLKPPRYPDGVYIKENSVSHRHLTWDLLNTPVYTFDTSLIISAENKIKYFKAHYSFPPLKLNECIYISPSTYFGIELINRNAKPLKVIPPHSFLFYSDTIAYKDTLGFFTGYEMHLKLKNATEDLYQPFYFKKSEVTNKEYREFVYWVRDSIARDLLVKDGNSEYVLKYLEKNKYLLNQQKKINWNDTSTLEILDPIYLPPEERFYKRRELDSRRMLYKYSINGITEEINVYPDTLVWENDFLFALLEQNSCLYFWHPAYDDFPVVGINQLQAKAFLIWKTKQKQEELDKQDSNYIVKYELPNEKEWEMMATKSIKMIFDPEYRDFYDNNFTTTLLLKEDTCRVIKTIKENNSEGGTKKYVLTFPATFQSKSILYFKGGMFPGQHYLFKSNLRYNKRKSYPDIIISASRDENGIEFMGGNVSEWMSDTYKDNWLPIYTYHQNKLKKINTKYSKQLLNIERMHDSQNDTNGVLVRGGNWFDLSLSSIGSKNFEGMNKKKFVDPMKAYSTVGFRYVIKVYRKDEQELLQNQTKTK